MKKSVSVFLLILFLFNIAGMFGLFSLLKHKNYESYLHRSSTEEKRVLLTIPKTEAIHWEKENEIVYRGKYYDVLSKSEDEKNFIFNCYSDSHDNLLVDIFSKHTSDQQSDNTSGKRSNHSVKIIIQDFVLDTFAWKIQIVKQVKSESQILFSIASGFHSVFSPPPELR